MNSLKFSFVIPVYNTGSYLDTCLKSIVSQNVSKDMYEIIIVNDCSTDNSLSIINEYKTKYSNFLLIDKKENEGTFWARIDGFQAASGEYVIVVDSDDWISTSLLEHLLKIIHDFPADMIEFGYFLETEENSVVVQDSQRGYHKIEELLCMFTERKTISALWRRIYSKKVIIQCIHTVHKYFDRLSYKSLCVEDEFIFPILLNSSETYYVSDIPIYHYREFRDGSSMSSIAVNPNKKLLHAALTVKAAEKVLAIYGFNNNKSAYYFNMQTNNLFYYMGQIILTKNAEELVLFSNALKTHICNFKKLDGNIWSNGVLFSLNLIIRFFHLKFKYKLISK